MEGERSTVVGVGGGRDKRGQIKSRERVQNLAEVYTHQREVSAMLDLVPDMFPSAEEPGNTDCRFLEPACGNGNFLVEILVRKLGFVTTSRYGRGERFEHRVLRCLASIYGIDISEDNVSEARERMSAVVETHVSEALRGEPSKGFRDAVAVVLGTNLVQADTLAGGAGVELVEYAPEPGGAFTREWSFPLAPAADLNLFSAGPRRDEAPVHYSELVAQTGPAATEPAERTAA